MKRFLTELQARLRTATPDERARIFRAFQELARGIEASSIALRSLFKPSRTALGLIMSDLLGAMAGGPNLLERARKMAPSIGPDVAELVQTF